MGFQGKHTLLSRELMKTGTWDYVLDLIPETFEGERDDIINWTKTCKEINKKCDLFLKSRGIILDYNGESKSRTNT